MQKLSPACSLLHLTLLLTLLAQGRPLLAKQLHHGDRPRVTVVRPQFADAPERVPTFVPFHPVQRPRVALVLSGGGSRGISAIGVLKALEEHRIPVDLVVGTSMGSIIGGLYAAGYSTEQLYRMADTTRWDVVLSFNDDARRRDLFLDQKLAEDRSILVVRFDRFAPIIPSAYSTGQTLLNYLNILTLQGIYHPNPGFDNLRMPFRAVATDLVSGQQVVIDHGDLALAMRASMTVPLLFTPVVQDSMQLVDGGLVSNIPAKAARDLGADLVIAVDATSPLRPANRLNAVWEIADQIMGVVMQGKKDLDLQHADVVITPELGDHLSTDFSRIPWIVDQGEEAARSQVDSIHSLLVQKRRAAVTAGAPYTNPRVLYDVAALGAEWANRMLDFARTPVITPTDLQDMVNTMYESGDFVSVEAHVTELPDRTVLDVQADRTPLLRGLSITGSAVIPLETLRAEFSQVVGRRLNAHRSREAFESVLGLYRDRGFSLARIRGVTFDSTTGIGTVDIDEGLVYRRDIRGSKKTKDYVIWRELPWKQGDVFRVNEVAQGITNLYGTNLFEHVSVGISQEGERGEHQIVTINVTERSTDLIRLGLRIDNERNVQPSIDVRDENFLGIGSELGVRFTAGQRNRTLVGEFKANRIFDSYLAFNLKGYYAFRDVNVFGDEPISDPARWNRTRVGEYRALRYGGSMAFGTQLERLGVFTVEGRSETHRVWSIFNRPVETESFRFASLRFGIKVDSQDRFPFPREGVALTTFYETAVVKVKNNVGFTKVFVDYESASTYFSRHTVTPRIVFGFADETLPITEQFSLGGQDSFFGLREDNARGRQLLVASLDYRYSVPFRLFFDTYVKARYDFGSIWVVPEQIKLGDLRHGIGVGLLFDTPIGPAEFAVGKSFFFRKELLDRPVSLGPTLFYFSIGYPVLR
jgi:NTE family protein